MRWSEASELSVDEGVAYFRTVECLCRTSGLRAPCAAQRQSEGMGARAEARRWSVQPRSFWATRASGCKNASGLKPIEAERVAAKKSGGAEPEAERREGKAKKSEAEGRVNEAQGVWGGWVPPRSGASEVMQ